ncbi:MAG TPA: hypothetical protein VJN90_09060 [Candidatus Acidoferrales bacterium]|nr:hypothetical protein [Candidatus Acidoferrales bacterium]
MGCAVMLGGVPPELDEELQPAQALNPEIAIAAMNTLIARFTD